MNVTRIWAFFLFVGLVLYLGYDATASSVLLLASGFLFFVALLLIAYEYSSGDQ